jgi:hypothetical protein
MFNYYSTRGRRLAAGGVVAVLKFCYQTSENYTGPFRPKRGIGISGQLSLCSIFMTGIKLLTKTQVIKHNAHKLIKLYHFSILKIIY